MPFTYTKSSYPTLLRSAVLLHGERCNLPWWSSTGVKSGASDIRYALPRTAMTAALSRAAALAKSLHDERTKQQDLYHLFRLPHAIEADIHREMIRLEQAGELAVEKIEDFHTDFMAGTEPLPPEAEGPVDCGHISIFNRADLKRICSLYKQAFDSGKVCLPYFLLRT